MHRRVLSAALGGVVFVALGCSAQALNTRTWISATGVDQAGCGPIANPCRTLQFAHDQTSAGGEIDVKDAAGYGSVNITKAISIVGSGSLAGVLGSNGVNAISINAGASDAVVLRGLTIEGAGASANGISFVSGGKLDISDCTVQNFTGNTSTGNGIALRPTSGNPAITIVRTNVSFNQAAGIFFYTSSGNPTANPTIVMEGVVATSNGTGFSLQTGNAGRTRISVANSTASNNLYEGILIASASPTPMSVSLDHIGADLNGENGVNVIGGAVRIGRSRASDNTKYGLATSSGVVTTFGDNRMLGNGLGATQGAPLAPGALN